MNSRMKCCVGMLTEAVSVEYVGPVRKLKKLVEDGFEDDAEVLMDSAFDKSAMMEQLIEKLRGKSVHKTLSRAAKGKCSTALEHVKGLTSLCTHIIIECEHGRNEYRVLLHDVHERIGQLMTEI